MIKIEHTALYVEDLEKARRFFEDYFEGKSNNRYENKNTGFRSYFIIFAGGARLELMNFPGAFEASGREGHMAFSVGSRAAVDRLTERLSSDGYPVLSGPRVTGDGYYESCIAGIEGNKIEITV